MNPILPGNILRILWPLQKDKIFTDSAGHPVIINSPGDWDSDALLFRGAEAIIEGVVHRGDVVIESDYSEFLLPASVILRITDDTDTEISSLMSQIPLITVDIPVRCTESYKGLILGSQEYQCGTRLKEMDSPRRLSFLTGLTVERLQRKCREIRELYEENEKDWNQTMFAMILRWIGGPQFKEAFTELGRKLNYRTVSRERNSLRTLEAMFIGASGLLDRYDDDSYIRDLKAEFVHLASKYSIIPMLAYQWPIRNTNSSNHPILRLAQLAAFFSSREFIFDNVVGCRKVEDVHLLFRAEASDYWTSHFTPANQTPERPKRIGHMAANTLGINLVVPIMFSYGEHTGDDELKERAMELLEKTVCEDNRIVNGWKSRGLIPENAFDSQALIQLYNEYCTPGRCHECRIGKKIISTVYGAARECEEKVAEITN